MPKTPCDDRRLRGFVETVVARGREHYRDFPWRHETDPYALLVSEVMLQQTQATRVVAHYVRWLEAFPTFEALAAAPLEAVLREWQGLGYNRRAVALKRIAETLVELAPADAHASLPEAESDLTALPGVGPATAAGVRAFAFGKHGVYLETNVRSVVLHELFPEADGVADSEVSAVVAAAARCAETAGVGAREWNWALLDYGAHLKRIGPNPSRRSAHHSRQTPFEGSRRQMRARLLRLVMESPGGTPEEYAEMLSGGAEREAHDVHELIGELAREGFLAEENGRFRIP